MIPPLRPDLEPHVSDHGQIGAAVRDQEPMGPPPTMGASTDSQTESWNGPCVCPEDCPRDHPNE